MVDVETRINTHAHVAGLKRLSARANAGVAAGSSSRRVCFSFAAYARNVIEHLRRCHVSIARGLGDEEFERIEAGYGITFPPDLRGILQEGLPVGVGFPDWRQGSSQQLRMRLNLPVAGLLHEVARGRFWWKTWGPRPVDADQALKLARAALRRAPLLLPIYNHCYIPCSPNLAGNPVFFVHQKDVFYCGYDLADYFQREAFIPRDLDVPLQMQMQLQLPLAESKKPDSKKVQPRNERSQAARLRVREDDDGEGRKLPWIEEGNEGAECRAAAVEEQEARRVAAGAESSSGRPESESWGRHLDSLAQAFAKGSLETVPARKSDASEPVRQPDGWWRASSAIDSQASPRKLAEAVLYGQTLPAHNNHFVEKRKDFGQFTISAPPWAAKSARRIEFWTDLVERKHLNAAPADTHFTSYKVEGDAMKAAPREVVWEDQARNEFRRKFMPMWLTGYLEDLGTQLRKGGWSDTDVAEMLETLPVNGSEPLSKQLLMDRLSVQVEMLASTLRQAGWSMQDVAEILNSNPLWQQRRAMPKITPELALKIGKITEPQVSHHVVQKLLQKWHLPQIMKL